MQHQRDYLIKGISHDSDYIKGIVIKRIIITKGIIIIKECKQLHYIKVPLSSDTSKDATISAIKDRAPDIMYLFYFD